jgi:hypothetical protein
VTEEAAAELKASLEVFSSQLTPGTQFFSSPCAPGFKVRFARKSGHHALLTLNLPEQNFVLMGAVRMIPGISVPLAEETRGQGELGKWVERMHGRYTPTAWRRR